jgi:hypothetical protein
MLTYAEEWSLLQLGIIRKKESLELLLCDICSVLMAEWVQRERVREGRREEREHERGRGGGGERERTREEGKEGGGERRRERGREGRRGGREGGKVRERERKKGFREYLIIAYKYIALKMLDWTLRAATF